jgi:hypothetical protein
LPIDFFSRIDHHDTGFSSIKVGKMAGYKEVGRKKGIMDGRSIWLISGVGMTG